MLGRNITISGNIISSTGGGGGTTTEDYNDLFNKPSINGIVLRGNLSLEDLGIPTTYEYQELTSYYDDYFFNVKNTSIGSNVPSPTYSEGSKSMILKVSDLPSTKFRISGMSFSGIWFTCSDNPLNNVSTLIRKSLPNQSYSNYLLDVPIDEEANYIVFNFDSSDEPSYVVKVEVVTETSYGNDDYDTLQNKPSINGVQLIGDKSFEDLGLVTTKNYEEITSYSDGYFFNVNSVGVNEVVPEPSATLEAKYMVLALGDYPTQKFRVSGFSSSSYWFTTDLNPLTDEALLRRKSQSNSGLSNEEIQIPFIPNQRYVVFNFTNVSEDVPKVEYVTESVSGNAKAINLNDNLVLVANTQITLEEGLYNTGSYKVYLHSVDNANVLIGNNELIYVANGTTLITDNYNIILVDSGGTPDWDFDNHSGVTSTLENDDSLIATSGAVYRAIQNISPSGDSFYTELTQNVVCNQDGTITPTLTSGYYYLPSDKTFSYYNSSNQLVSDNKFVNNIFYYNSNTDKIYLCLINNDGLLGIIDYFGSYWEGSNYWTFGGKDIDNYVYNGLASQSQVLNSIPASGSNNDVPNINAVRNGLSEKLNNNEIQVYSTSEERIVGKWINDKPLYEKTFEIQFPSVTTSGTYVDSTAVQIDTNVDLAFIKNAWANTQGQYTNHTGSNVLFPFTNSAGNGIRVRIGFYSSKAVIYVGSSDSTFNNGYAYVCVQYTKTTD